MQLNELKKIGLTEGEIKIYQALLILGETTKTNLAKQSGISPSNIYDVTNRLIEKGIISKVKKNGIAHFSPANPKHILHYLEQKKQEIQKEEDVINQILPSLLAEFQKVKEKVNVEVFQGWKGLKTIFDDLINECNKNDYNYVFGASKGESEKQADIFFLKYSKIREKKGIITNIIFNEELRKRKTRIDFFLKSKNYKIKFLQQTTPAEILMYKNKSCIIILTKNPLIIRITSKEVTSSFKQYFDIMWKIAKK
ncbi:MAG: TrmB family transcriptional regulator [Candidatus Woesearchaeota archaeon]